MDGTVWCWGSNVAGQVGNGKETSAAVTSPTQVAGLTNMKAVSVGDAAACAVKGDGTVWCWGSDVNGELGVAPGSLADCHLDGDTNNPPFKCNPTAAQVPGVTGAASVAMCAQTGHALKSDGTVVGWGENGYGALGNGMVLDGPQPPTSISGFKASAIAAWGLTYDSICAIGSDGGVYCWGDNYLAALGEDPKSVDHEDAPTKVMGMPGSVVAIDQNGAAGAIMQDGTLWQWGLEDGVGVPTPSKIDGLN
jgi:alpha-tubulin suppressor-like RCC1 family protein